jgi:hypothetical protein
VHSIVEEVVAFMAAVVLMEVDLVVVAAFTAVVVSGEEAAFMAEVVFGEAATYIAEDLPVEASGEEAIFMAAVAFAAEVGFVVMQPFTEARHTVVHSQDQAWLIVAGLA